MSAPAEAVRPMATRKPRGPRKSTVKALASAREQGFNEGLNAPRDRWPGAIAATALAVVAFVAGAMVF